jgi:hypothetical protein
MAGFYENITVSAAVPNAAADAEAAKDAAVTAKNEAEAAKDAAEVAKNLAEQHKDTASGYVGTVSGAQSIADANVASTAGDRQAAEDARDLAYSYGQAASLSAQSAEISANSVSANAATVAGMADNVDIVAGLQNTLVTLAHDLGIGGNITTVRPYVNQIDTVAGMVSNVATVAADAADIGTVATDLTGSNNIGTVAGLAPKINTVAGLSSELTSVHGNNADITTVATSLNAGNIIANVSSSIGNVNNVGNKLAEIEAVKNALSDIAAVENKLTEIDNVSDSITNVDSVAGVISEVQTVAGVSDEVANLSKSTGDISTLVSKLGQTSDLAGAVTDAQNSATSAASSASTASTQATTASGHASTAATHAANLGSVAYQDLTAIAESKAVTATDVFVYDTSKDSDGGAWRNRTQGTSWYNEPLNTSSRGATKKFPAVAVIVTESNKVTIYDADDPSMPMWFTSRNTTTDVGKGVLRQLNSYNPTCVSAKDGKVFVGINISGNYASNEGLHYLDFVKDEAGKHVTSSGNTGKVTPLTAYPNTNVTADSSMGVLNSADVNDIAVTVLPNAPIDPDTGLPVLTIAVATDGGVNVIKDDGTVVDLTTSQSGYTKSKFVYFDSLNRIFFSFDQTGSRRFWGYNVIPTVDTVVTTTVNAKQNADYYFGDHNPAYGRDLAWFSASTHATGVANDAIATERGLFKYDINPQKANESLFSQITSSYNTGWMNGDIKLATLMDTTAETISAPEIANTAGNSGNTGGATWTIDNAQTVSVTSSTAVVGYFNRIATLEVGKQYTATLTLSNYSGTGTMGIGSGSGIGSTVRRDSNGSITHTFTATGDALSFFVRNTNSGTMHLSVQELVADRSVNGNGLNIVGNITKEAVATGAELVSYSGNSANYLTQPHNPDLDVIGDGTQHPYTMMGWFKSKTADSYLSGQGVLLSANQQTDQFISWQFNGADGSVGVWVKNTTGNSQYTSANVVLKNQWNHVVWVNEGGTKFKIYVNGKFVGEVDLSGDKFPTSITNREFIVCKSNSNIQTLVKFSLTNPTAEQIAKIYRDEKPLFQEGAKCTLSGKDDVQAIAYDEDTGKLHVGNGDATSGRYRDEFVGLQNVNPVFRDTYSIGTAISAVNGLVVEE